MRYARLNAYTRETSSAERILSKKIIKDIILIAVLLVLGISVFLIIEYGREDGTHVKVTVNGELIAEYSLNEDGEYLLNGGTNLLIISDGKAFIKDADCPDGLCINQGKISRSGERIVCLPNRVMIEVRAENDGVFIN